MSSSFQLQIARKYSTVDVLQFTVDAAATFKLNEFVFFDTSSQTLKECGTNPTLIMGIALAPAAMGLDTKGSIWGGTQIPVAVLKPSSVLFMCSPTTPAITHINVASGYDIVNTAGIWSLNPLSTANPRAFVQGISNTPQQEGFFVSIFATNLQSDAIAS